MKESVIFKEILEKINPSKEELKSIEKFLKDFIKNLSLKLKTSKIKAEVFVGGSFAKKTMIKKDKYDVDVFVRFDESFIGKDISKVLENVLKKMKNKFSIIHGSRDYFKIDVNEYFFLEIIPVIKVKNPKEAENITDLSYFHVGYIRKKVKTEKMLEEIRLAKAFCHANKCYGAESYIHGFSGYALELLVYYYGSFMKFIKAITKIKDSKEIIDIEKLYKNKYEVSINLNSAKMSSPIVLIDPTYKERNALAALSQEKFNGFRGTCINFLKKPSLRGFEIQKIELEKVRKKADKNKLEFIELKAETDKQEGDIAGSKLVKFYNHLSEEIKKFYEIKDKDFEYDGKKSAEFFFVVKNRGEILFEGPQIKDKNSVIKFRKKHKKTFVKKGRIYCKEKFTDKVEKFVKEWKSKNCQKMIEMHIMNLEIINQK